MYTLAVSRYDDYDSIERKFHLEKRVLINLYYYYEITPALYALLCVKYDVTPLKAYPYTKMGLCFMFGELRFDYTEDYVRAVEALQCTQ